MEEKEKRKLVTIRKIDNLVPIEGADFIELAKIDGWQCVVKKGDFKVGDFCLYFEVDSLLPDIEKYAFLKKGSTLKRVTIDGEVKVGIRLKTVKLRGTLSQGLALPLDSGFDTYPDIEVGTDVTEMLGVVKYEKPIPAELAGIAKGFFPSFIPKTDEERIQNMSKVLNRYYVTEKLDGSSVTYFKKDGVFGVCSRNLELTETEGNTFWKIARELDLENKIPDGFALQGELIGSGVQNNPYRLTGNKVYFFNVYKIEWKRYLDFNDFQNFIKGHGLETVPIVNDNYALPETVEEVLFYADGKSALCPEVDREGIVIRSKDEKEMDGRRVSFKAISNKYLMEEKDE